MAMPAIRLQRYADELVVDTTQVIIPMRVIGMIAKTTWAADIPQIPESANLHIQTNGGSTTSPFL